MIQTFPPNKSRQLTAKVRRNDAVLVTPATTRWSLSTLHNWFTLTPGATDDVVFVTRNNHTPDGAQQELTCFVSYTDADEPDSKYSQVITLVASHAPHVDPATGDPIGVIFTLGAEY